MEIPLLVCYTIDHALEALNRRGIFNISIINTGANFNQGDQKKVKRVIGQREKNDLIELIVC